MYVNDRNAGVNSTKSGAKKLQVFKPLQKIILVGAANGYYIFARFYFYIIKTVNILQVYHKASVYPYEVLMFDGIRKSLEGNAKGNFFVPRNQADIVIVAFHIQQIGYRYLRKLLPGPLKPVFPERHVCSSG
jgi:hypothetical protein